MATLLSSRPLRHAFLQLPPPARTTLYQRATCNRSFSSTPSRKSSATEIILIAPTALLDTVHAFGIPWYAAIPLTAIFVRGTIGYYIASLPARKAVIVRTHLIPVTRAVSMQEAKTWEMTKMEEFDKKRSASVRKEGIDWKILLLVTKYRIQWKNAHAIGKKFRAPVWSWRPPFNFAMLLAFSEVLRMKSGGKEGLLTLLFGSFRPSASTPSAASPAEALAEPLDATQRAKEEGAAVQQQSGTWPYDGSTSDSQLPNMPVQAPQVHLEPLNSNSSPYADFLDPSMKLEGLSWCQDLTLPDPTLILPLSMTIILIARVLIKPRVGREVPIAKTPQEEAAKEAEDRKFEEQMKFEESQARQYFVQLDKQRQEKKQKQKSSSNSLTFQQRFGLVMAIVFGYAATNFPAAIVLYIIPMLVTASVQSRWLDLKYPLPTYIVDCKGPKRMKVRKATRPTA